MDKKRTKKKLILSKETLVPLNEKDLKEAAVGGSTLPICASFTCCTDCNMT
jgi:hypothetical protein